MHLSSAYIAYTVHSLEIIFCYLLEKHQSLFVCLPRFTNYFQKRCNGNLPDAHIYIFTYTRYNET